MVRVKVVVCRTKVGGIEKRDQLGNYLKNKDENLTSTQILRWTPRVIRNDEGTRRGERAASMIVDSPKSEEHGLLKIKRGVCRLRKR
jgi:hypothetical protein